MTDPAAPGPAVHVTRRLTAPRDAVFAAWTEPEQLSQWFGPPGNQVTAAEVDLRVGGDYRLALSTMGFTANLVGSFLEIEPPERLVYTFSWDPPLLAMMDIGETRVSVQFRDLGDETEIVLLHEQLGDDPTVRTFHEFGWNGSIDRLREMVRAAPDGGQRTQAAGAPDA